MKGLSRDALDKVDVELKEAVCDAIVNTLVNRVSATDDRGAILYGRTPRRSVVSGQLLPRFDRRDEDETSDIRIAAMGLDFVVEGTQAVPITIQPTFSIYVRALPTWPELVSGGGLLDVDFKLKASIQKEIDAEIKERQREALTEAGLLKPKWDELDEAALKKVRERREALSREVYVGVYKSKRIELVAHDFDEGQVSGEIDAGDAGDPNAPEKIDEIKPAITRLLRDNRKIPFDLIDPAPIPGKWIRLPFKLPVLSWLSTTDRGEVEALLKNYNRELHQVVRDQFSFWLGTSGLDAAWRDEKVQPQDVIDEASWNAFLARIREIKPDAAALLPDLSEVLLKVEAQIDFLDPQRLSCRVLLDNQCKELDGEAAASICNTIFATGIALTIPSAHHRLLQLDRVEPSYRFRHYLDYPAIGLNCGVTSHVEGDLRHLVTTWSPRFAQPRIKPSDIDVPYRFSVLADPDFPVDSLLALPKAYDSWIAIQEEKLTHEVVRGLSDADAALELKELETDIAAQRAESRYIRRGIDLLIRSKTAADALRSPSPGDDLGQMRQRAAPWLAWQMTNESFARRDRADPKRGWRLFQMAFILAHIPVFASRMDIWADRHDPILDEETASLLYFPTGGGKSEAFYGALLFAMFLDRLRGKDRGVTAFIRYPLRLLTLQQAQRLLKLVVHAEIVRKEHGAGSWPFEMGFWVGSGNTPNRYSAFKADVPMIGDGKHPDDSILNRLDGDEDQRERAQRYRDTRDSFDKIPNCPCCGSLTGLRRNETEGKYGKRIAIVCFNGRCDWNVSHGGRHPLPFLLTDDAVYARAPAIVLGTVDKMAMLGQNTGTAANVFAMFGLARWIDASGNLVTPRQRDALTSGPEANDCEPVFPAYRRGRRVFKDPFPSLIIQDEAHLLEESLGTFSGLFDTLFETILTDIKRMSKDDLDIATWTTSGGELLPRMPKIIAATATISNPERQLDTLYQRRPLRFPYPGPDIYRSFFSAPAPAPDPNPDRGELARSLPEHLSAEATSPWMRLYVSLMTNDATHTVTTVNVLSAFHAIITELWDGVLRDDSRAAAIAGLRAAVSPGIVGDWHRAAIDRAVADERAEDIMALIDLHRIALAYVTNKKGGDQIIDALGAGIVQQHRKINRQLDRFDSELISGGIDMKEIQRVMEVSEASLAGREYPDISTTMRNIVATSAISHGVDVERFNSMFFAGLPSDVAEYIQASSRVGRTHVGFVMLLPTPQSRRDRYVVETHDIFHRFLERMIAPPAVERWAENAVTRTFASYVQAWTMLNEARQFIAADDARKEDVQHEDLVKRLGRNAGVHMVKFQDELRDFLLSSSGYHGHGSDHQGIPHYPDHYHRLMEKGAKVFADAMASSNLATTLQDYWKDGAVFKKPMTSLRDVDEAGVILAAVKDPHATGRSQDLNLRDVVSVMRIIRQQRSGAAELDADGGSDG